MRLIQLNEELEDLRGADGQTVAASQLYGSQGGPAEVGGKGSRIAAIEEAEGNGLTTVNGNGKAENGTVKRHLTLSQIKRLLFAKYGGGNGLRDHHPYELLGRDS
jgi:hypothetical protein